MITPGRDALEALVAAELAVPSEPGPGTAAAMRVAENIIARHGGGAVEAVLFYGACRREDDPTGLLDLYVLTSGHRAFHGRALAALLNALLPPTVLHWRSPGPGGEIRAKVAVMRLGQFERRLRPGGLDTTIWARFCQPSTLVHARDAAARRRVERAVAQALETAALWAVRLGPARAAPDAYWRSLFARTFGAELRPERSDRPDRLLAAAPDWYDQALPLALARLGLPPDAAGRLAPGRLGRWSQGWMLRRTCGKALNLLRLVKAAFTYEAGPDYLLDKIGRHTGVTLQLTAWQRRHPVLAAPALLWRLRRRGAVR
ncbi:hypothetical protein [Siccirubricoccus phaeus]|uniref:hypothetical protein n=1 Tax=Siccirubricoccus phaeus TaxID=2595053 RepID=UPI0011F34008|nr:hypothetical protein [Siccirubricoccus phaeus]